MPTTRRRRVRSLRHDVHPIVIAYLRDEDPDPEKFGDGARHALWEIEIKPGRLRSIYDAVSERLIADWIKRYPGTRPSGWWEWTATEPRQRIGGTGSLMSDFLAYAPEFHFGMATRWACEALIQKGWPNVSVNSMPAHWAPIEALSSAIPFDPADPPLFESEATYLQRLNLLLPGERKLLGPEDFEPEAAEHGPCLACDDMAREVARERGRV
jgi:hypothetical protein